MRFLEKLFQTVQPSLDVEELKKDDEFKKISQSHPMIYYEKIIEVINQINNEIRNQTYYHLGNLGSTIHTQVLSSLTKLCAQPLITQEMYDYAKFEKCFFTFFVNNYRPALYSWCREPYNCIQYSCGTRFNLLHMKESKRDYHLSNCKECHIYWNWDKEIKPEKMLEEAIIKFNEIEPQYDEYMKNKSLIENIVETLSKYVIEKYFHIKIVWPNNINSTDLQFIQIVIPGIQTSISFGDIYESIIMNESKKSFNEKI